MRRALPCSWRHPEDGMTVDNELLSAMWLIHSWAYIPSRRQRQLRSRADGILGEPTIMNDWRGELARSSLTGMQACLALLHDGESDEGVIFTWTKS